MTTRLATGRVTKAPLHTELGWIELQRGEAATARAAFSEVLREAPRSADARKGLIAANLANRKVDVARKQVAAWEAAAPADVPLKLLSADVEMAAGNRAAAEQTLHGVIATDASQLDAYGMLARVYVSQGKVDDAIQQYQAIAQRSPSGAASAKTMIGMLQEAKNDRDAARTAYQQALSSDPQSGVAEQPRLDLRRRKGNWTRPCAWRRPHRPPCGAVPSPKTRWAGSTFRKGSRRRRLLRSSGPATARRRIPCTTITLDSRT